MRQGFFPPPALPGFIGTTSPSAICVERPHPSRARRCHRGCHRDHIRTGFPCCAQVLSRTCRHHYPGGTIGCESRSLPQPQRPSSLLWRVGFRIDIFGACSVFTSVTARTLRFPPYRGVFLKCFRPFVASWPAPSTSGRSESGRVGIAPTELVHLRQGTHNNVTERALKRAIQHRKNSLFYKTLNGARVGDTFMLRRSAESVRLCSAKRGHASFRIARAMRGGEHGNRKVRAQIQRH